MNLYYLLALYLFLQTRPVLNTQSDHLRDRVQLHNELNRELRNAVCCINNMKCCKHDRRTADIEIRAVLVRCPNTACEGSVVTRRYKKPIYSTREHDIKEFQGFDEDEPLSQSLVTNCRKKLLLTIRISGSSSDNLKNEYIVVDHVYDPITKKNTRILTPYVIKLRQEPIMQMYGLKFLHVVNAQAREDIYNKHDGNYTGCDTSSNKPTCGKITYKGKIIPFSQGFCCSCDAVKNSNRQPESLTEYADNSISYSDPAFLLDGVECPRNLKGRDNVNQAEDLIKSNEKVTNQRDKQGDQLGFQKVLYKTIPVKLLHAVPNNNKSNIKAAKRTRGRSKQTLNYKNLLNDFIQVNRVKRQVLSSGAQRRGGQNCADRYTPKGANPDTYHESTHCLRFSDVWYTVYHLQEPIVEHSVLFQIFEKHEDIDGHTTWRDTTRGKMIRVGTMNRKYVDEKNTISIKYSSKSQTIDPMTLSLNYKSALLLVPEGVSKSDCKKYPEVKGGPDEYLVVHANQISLDGDQCNVAGVGFEAFVKQPNRCSRPKGTCLANQPYNLWRHDHEAEKQKKKGCFFLKHYGKIPQNPIRKNPKTGDQYLVLEYTGSYASTVDMEIRADFNTVLRSQSTAKITEVYVDSTSAAKTILTVKITNSGLTSSSFMARLTDCPLEMPASFNNIQTKPALIPPQHQHIFHLEIKCPLPADRFHCSVEALNCNGELVALRRIRLQKFDRCICTWHCLCACVGSSEGLKCIPMSLQHYHAAGFQGSLPVTSYVVHFTLFDDIMSFIFHIMFFVILIILSLGLCKALIGVVYPYVGFWGLDVILDLPRPMKRYHEYDLLDRKVYYDDMGWPVHPDTKKKVRSISHSTQFCTNAIFFFAYPFNVAILLMKRICCPQYMESGCWHGGPTNECICEDDLDQNQDDFDTCTCPVKHNASLFGQKPECERHDVSFPNSQEPESKRLNENPSCYSTQKQGSQKRDGSFPCPIKNIKQEEANDGHDESVSISSQEQVSETPDVTLTISLISKTEEGEHEESVSSSLSNETGQQKSKEHDGSLPDSLRNKTQERGSIKTRESETGTLSRLRKNQSGSEKATTTGSNKELGQQPLSNNVVSDSSKSNSDLEGDMSGEDMETSVMTRLSEEDEEENK